MAERTLSHLNYGHVGSATFDLDAHEWTFSRQFTTIRLQQIKIRDRVSLGTTAVLPAAKLFTSSAVSTRITDVKENLKVLLENHPQLVPAQDVLPELAAPSAAVIATSAAYDPLIGSLFSIGSITFETRSDKWENPRRIAATVTGEAGNVLRLALFYKETLGWGNDKSVWIRGDTLFNTESGYWNKEAAPIQQVCFAQSDDRSNLLAVRLLTRTVIFRPSYTQQARPASHSPCYKLPSSILDAHAILSLGINQTGGSPHADVSFNPDFQLQFAIVDQNQLWSVWDIDHRRKSDEYTLSCLVQGHTVPPENVDLSREDGWARILWVGDVNTILVCNRRQLSIIAFRAGYFEYLQCPPLSSDTSSDWILDVKPHPSTRGCFLVLTSTSLFFMAVTTPNEALDSNVDQIGGRILMTWRHYRGADDLTLSITAQILDEDELCVLLYSRLNSLVQTYYFMMPSSYFPASISSADPTLLELAIDVGGHMFQLEMEPLRYQGDISSEITGLGRSYVAQGIRFYKLFVLQSDLSVHEVILYGCHSHHKSTREHRLAVEDLFWSTAYRPRKDVRMATVLHEMSDLIEDREINPTDGLISRLPSQAAEHLQNQQASAARRVTDYGSVYKVLSQKESGMEANTRTIDVSTVTAQLQRLATETYNLSDLPLGTLMELTGMDIDDSDVDKASSSLDSILAIENQDDLIKFRCIASASLLHIGEVSHPTISSLYDSIIQNWIASLPSDVPLRIRQRKERLARRIAAEVMLAGTRIFQQAHATDVIEFQPRSAPNSALSMPILPSQPVGRGSTISKDVSSSQAQSSNWSSESLPTLVLPVSSLPSPFETSTTDAQQSSLNASFPIISPPLSATDSLGRLSKHLKFREGSEPETVPEASINQLLAHWQLGTDPRAYDWDAAERVGRITDLDDTSQEQLTKAQKRKERRERKQKREDELLRAQPSNQPFVFSKPTVILRSSPGPTLGGMPSSSQVGSQASNPFPPPSSILQSQGSTEYFTAQSQVEPGRYGGRPDRKKKKKGRVSGF